MKILAFTGSLRKESFNLKLLKIAQKIVVEEIEIEIFDLSKIPFYNQDLETVPFEVNQFIEAIKKADGFLIATPEYNYSIPPVLKNALDWASLDDAEPLSGKVAAIMSASPSMLGGARAQYHLRQVAVGLDLSILNYPEIFISKAHDKFDVDGNLKDEFGLKMIKDLLINLKENIEQKKKVQ